MIKIEKRLDVDYEKYNALVDKKSAIEGEYTIAHNPVLPKLLAGIFNYDIAYYHILSNDEVIGYMPGCEINNRFVSLPHFSYGGPVTSSSLSSYTFIKEEISKFEIRNFHKLSEDYSDNKVTSYLILDKSAEDQHKSFKYNIRRQIKIAQKNIIIKSGKKELLDDFYCVYAQNMQRLGSPPQPKHFFGKLLSNYEFGETKLFCAYHENLCIGGSFYLSYKEIAEICWSATNWKYNRYYTPYLLYWELIKYAIDKKMKVFSFGRSSLDSGSLEFKRHWNSSERKIFYNLSEPKHSNEAYKKLSAKIWSSIIPVKLGIVLGRKLTKHLY